MSLYTPSTVNGHSPVPWRMHGGFHFLIVNT